MFDTISRLFKKDKQPSLSAGAKAEIENVDVAYEKGRQFFESQIDAKTKYIDGRYTQIKDGYLQVLQDCLDKARGQVEHSPILVARVEYSLFIEHVDQAQTQLFDEVGSIFEEWDDLNRQMDCVELINKWTHQQLDDKFTALKLEGLKLLQDNADILKTAEDRWRTKFPELAAAQPLE